MKSMWGIAWGIKIKTSVFKTDVFSYNTEIFDYLNGSGERIRTSDLVVMSHARFLCAKSLKKCVVLLYIYCWFHIYGALL